MVPRNPEAKCLFFPIHATRPAHYPRLMPIEPPDPTGKSLETLRDVLRELQGLGRKVPDDARIPIAIVNVSAAVLALEAPSPKTSATT